MNTKSPRTYSHSVPGFTQYDRDVHENETVGLEEFVRISAELTGFTAAELQASGMMRAHFEEFRLVLGLPLLAAFLSSGLNTTALLNSRLHGPLARNLIRVWYVGQWKRLPDDWLAVVSQELSESVRDRFNEFGRNSDRVISSNAYKRGLAWTAIGAHAPGTGHPGFGSWALPPT
jgi:hypothetical protein